MAIKKTAGPSSPVYLTGIEEGALNTGGQGSGAMRTKSIFRPLDNHKTQASLNAAKTLTPVSGANAIMLGIDSQNVKMTMDGTTATTGLGFTLIVNTWAIIQFSPGTTFSFIEAAASATIQYQWGVIE